MAASSPMLGAQPSGSKNGMAPPARCMPNGDPVSTSMTNGSGESFPSIIASEFE
jgi:hypothetical protein